MECESLDLTFDPLDDVLVQDDSKIFRVPKNRGVIRKRAPIDNNNPEYDEDDGYQTDTSDTCHHTNLEGWEEDVWDNDLPVDETRSTMFMRMGGQEVGGTYSAAFLDHVDGKEPLFSGSSHTLQDFSRYMLALKQSMPIGDEIFASIVGTVVSFLPADSAIGKCLEEGPSTYKLMQVLSVTASLRSDLRTPFQHVQKGLYALPTQRVLLR